MKRSAFISDIIFAFFVAFICTLFLFRYVGIGLFPATLLAVLCGILTACAIFTLLQSKRKTIFLKRSDEAKKTKLLFHFACLSDEGKTNFFLQNFPSDTPIKRFGRLRFVNESHFYLLHFTFAPVTADEIAAFSRLKTSKEKVLLCSKIEDDAYALAQKLNIRTLTGNEVYATLKDANALPEQYIGDENREVKRKRRFELWFSRKNAKPFLTAAALTLFTAFISPFPYYYFIFGGILLFTSVIIRIFGKL
jgi:hypothetical protein